jgi:HK97 family phage portal protein
MRLPFGITITRTKALSSVPENRGGWFPLVRESFGGAWQRNVEARFDTVLSFHADFACRTLIASDIAKLRPKLVQKDANGVWQEISSPAYSPVLRKPNHFQNRIQFLESWVLSKLQSGNAYILKERDARSVVVGLYVLDPNRVHPLVSEDGAVFYRLSTDNISGLPSEVIVPAREVIHDRFNCMFHPLVGISPIYANGLAAMQGLNMQTLSARLFKNNARPSGILTAPGSVNEADVARLKIWFEQNFGGDNVGRVAVVGNGLKYEKMAITAVEGQMIEQLKWTAEVVCSTYHVPLYKIGVGPQPTVNNVQSLNIEYYSQCLQRHIEDIELCLDEGLGVAEGTGTELDLEGLLRMDSVTQMEVADKGVKAGILAPNEGRRRIDLPPAPGGDTPYLQQQNYSLAALAKRDAREDPFARQSGGRAPKDPDADGDDDADADGSRSYEDRVAGIADLLQRSARSFQLDS